MKCRNLYQTSMLRHVETAVQLIYLHVMPAVESRVLYILKQMESQDSRQVGAAIGLWADTMPVGHNMKRNLMMRSWMDIM